MTSFDGTLLSHRTLNGLNPLSETMQKLKQIAESKTAQTLKATVSLPVHPQSMEDAPGRLLFTRSADAAPPTIGWLYLCSFEIMQTQNA